ncbi:DsbA family protein [Marinobacter halodurans]|uniref:DsbA family protein n=1 Tax=Marinobacter halodurans TaxID=2528979 RepID=A0ABY1ZIV3_9GAMM|nr:DsbA family protein [Marinobacter halodurans]TBW54643.1 DsbA family protein [Marinobacter halodurans]
MVNVHYIFDPMCGWCYGASSLIDQLRQMEGIDLQLHPGGMLKPTPIGVDFRQHILASDKRIAEQTGQTFGERYLEKVASGEALVLDSYMTAQAIIATERLGRGGFDMLRKIQDAHYQHGLPVSEPDVLAALARQLNIEPQAWGRAMQTAEADLATEIQRTHELMRQFGLGGFPSMVFEADGRRHTVAISRFYGRPNEWKAYWRKVLESQFIQTTAHNQGRSMSEPRHDPVKS